MKALQIILLVLAFGVGAGLVYALKSRSGEDSNEELTAKLAAAEKRISELESKRRPEQSPAPSALASGSSESGTPTGRE